jgi:hypothetical protein
MPILIPRNAATLNVLLMMLAEGQIVLFIVDDKPE